MISTNENNSKEKECLEMKVVSLNSWWSTNKYLKPTEYVIHEDTMEKVF